MHSSAPRTAAPVARIVALADQCVKCGLCLPHCPSYRVAGEEGESPRGRIAFARALALGTLTATPTVQRHLDGCLACGSCESACPSGVAFMDLIVETRRNIPRSRAASAAARFARTLARHRLPWRLLMRVRFLGSLARTLRRWPRVAAALEVLRGLPDPAGRIRAVAPRGAAKGRIALFRGCAASAIDEDTHAAVARVLAHLGYEVAMPSRAHCCGALARHAGALEESARDVARAAAVMAGTACERIASSATGCAGAIHDEVSTRAGVAADDVLELVARDAPGLAGLRPDPRRIVLMLPCTQRHAGGPAPVLGALACVPGIELFVLPQQPRCCGAAGTYFLEQPAVAEALRDERLDQIEALAPDLVLTTNVGCRIHLQAGLRARGSALRVVHPITLLAEALPT